MARKSTAKPVDITSSFSSSGACILFFVGSTAFATSCWMRVPRQPYRSWGLQCLGITRGPVLCRARIVGLDANPDSLRPCGD